MKKQLIRNIIIASLAVLLLSVLATVAILAAGASTQTYGETLGSISANVGGKVSLKFTYKDLGSAGHYVTEVYNTDGTLKEQKIIGATSIVDKTITVALTPSEMANTVKVYPATVENGEITARGEGKSYSVREYALAVIASDSEDHTPHHNTMRALLNWGAMAETLFDGVATPRANVGLYSRDTNPISAVNTSFAVTAGKIDEKASNDYGCSLTMSIGEDSSVFNFKFSGLPEGTYTATVSKDGGVTEAPATIKNGTVSISNVGVAVYDRSYTVTVKDSSGNVMIKATANALYYLDQLAFDKGENAKYNDIAKSMYQLYTLAMNKSFDNCDHLEAHWAKNDAETSYIVCSKCFLKIDGRAVNDNVNWYANIAEIAGNSAVTADGVGVQNENGISYKGFDSASGGIIFLTHEKPYASTFTSESFTTGNYIVIKYRTGKEAGLKLAGGTTSNTRHDFGILTAANQTTDWKVSVIDATSVAKWTAAENQIAELRFLVQGTMTVDVAMVAVVDNKAEIASLLGAEETYFMHDATFTTKGLELNRTGTCVSGCTYSESKSAGVYTYSCSACKDTVKRAVPSGVGYFANIVDLDSYAGAGATTSVHKDDDGFLYKRYTGEKILYPVFTSASSRVFEAVDSSEIKNYLVIKYRSTSGNVNNVNLQVITGTSGATTDGSRVNISLGKTLTVNEWTVEIIDLTNITNYSNTDTGLYISFYYAAYTNETLDIAYVALADSEETARELLDEGETYKKRTLATDGKSASITGTFSKDGTCPENGCAITLENIEGGIKYVCNNCGTVFETRTVPTTVNKYASPDTLNSTYCNGSSQATKNLMAEDGVVFKRFVNAPDAAKGIQTALTLINEEVSGGNYIVIKYRTNCSNQKTAMTFSISSTSMTDSEDSVSIRLPSQNTTASYLSQPTDGLWLTGYVDLTGTTLKDQITAGRKTNVKFTMVHPGDGSEYTVDIAFVAIVSSPDDAEALVSEGDTLTEGIYDTDWTVAQFNKDLDSLIKDKATNELQFLHFSDVHRSLTPWNRVVDYYNTYSAYIDFAVHSGDYVGSYNYVDDEGKDGYVDLYGKGTESTNPIYNVVGNHDVYAVAGGATHLEKADVISTLFNKTDNWNVNYMGESGVNTSYYRDFTEQKVRFIVLDNYYDEEGQVEWLQGLLNETLDENSSVYGYHVLTSMHEPTAKIVTPLDSAFHCSIEQTSAFRTSLFDEVLGNFIKNGGSFIANLTGHWHVDLAGYTANGVLNLTVEIASAGAVGAEQLDGRPQVQGERGYDAFNVITVNTESGTLEIVRIGNNSDSIGREKTSLVLDYVNKEIISENGKIK